jgi:diacylglycerol kinase (ATP)
MRLSESVQKVKVIFNLQSGREEDSPLELTNLLRYLQDLHLVSEVHLIQPEDDVVQIAADAAQCGFGLVIASGGDGTVSLAASGLIDTSTCLGIIPTGTRNNQALSHGIPLDDMEAAVKVLRQGEIIQIDTGLVHCNSKRHPLIEVASLGLTSALFPSTDEIQRGELAKIGEFVQVMLAHPLSHIEAELDDGEKKVEMEAHTVLITNMPYTGARWKLTDTVSFDDGLLDVFFFPEMSKIDLINTVLQMDDGLPEDERILHYQVRNARFHSPQPLPVMVDGMMLGECDFYVEVKPRSLRVISNLSQHEIQKR